MKIGLIDIDNKIANLPLMKIKSYYKNNCDWYDGFSKYDKVYISKIFDFSKDYEYYIKAAEIIKGGTGYDIKSKLSDEIENCQPDYSIYPDCDYSVQYFSRGCIRSCPYCIVQEKEGWIYPVSPMNLNPKGEWIEILDNNFFANPQWEEAIKYLRNKKQPVNFHGIDVRLINEKQCQALNSLKHIKQIHIGWDNPKENLIPKIQEMIKYIKPYKIMCYVLIGYWSSKEEDYYRVQKLKSLGIDPFVMPYNKDDPYQNNFTRWCDFKAIFKRIKWKWYKWRF